MLLISWLYDSISARSLIHSDLASRIDHLYILITNEYEGDDANSCCSLSAKTGHLNVIFEY
jgi:hypothetical protein